VDGSRRASTLPRLNGCRKLVQPKLSAIRKVLVDEVFLEDVVLSNVILLLKKPYSNRFNGH